MKKIVKLYYPIIISSLFMFILSLLVSSVFNGGALINETNFGIIMVFITFILVIALWAEIIGFIIHVVKSDIKDKILWALLIYFLNLFVIPYYNIKYIVKENNVKKYTIIYIVLMIIGIISGIFLSTSY